MQKRTALSVSALVIFALSTIIASRVGAAIVTKVEQVALITGANSINHTDNFLVMGTDLGITWQHGAQYLTAFGDTYGSGFTPPPGSGPAYDWRCNTLMRSTASNLSGGLIFSDVAMDWLYHAKQILGCTQIDGQEWTVIPTAGISVGTRAYINYMSVVSPFQSGGYWTTNYADIAYSDNNGDSWQKGNPSQPRWPNSGWRSNFQQAAFVRKGDGFIYMFATPNGRHGAAYLARVPEGSVLTTSAYQYWSWVYGWVGGDGTNATSVVPAPVGELSVQYIGGMWFMMYLNEDRHGIVLREAGDPTGPWSSEQIIVDSWLQYPDLNGVLQPPYSNLYGGFIDPRSSSSQLYFTMSLWSDYNVRLMRATLGGITAPDVGQCGAQGAPYGNCVNCGCAGPSLLPNPSWFPAHFQVRYKCCFNPNWGNWQDVGTNTSYPAPFAVFDYEVQVLGLTDDGSFVQWYPWTSGNKNGTTQNITWQAAQYAAQLNHADQFLNACNDGAGSQLQGCVDARPYNTSTTATFSGLSPGERYSLFVDIKDSQNTGITRHFNQQFNLGPTGSCICAPPPTPTPSPTPTPTPLPVISSDCMTPVILRPSSNGGLNNWDSQFPASGSHWDKLADITSDGDTTYISSTIDARWDQFNHPSLSLVPGATISSVTVYANARYATSSTNNIVGPALRIGSNYYWADRAITGSYSTVSGTWSTNPATGQPWTLPDINAALISVRKSYQGADVRVTQLWAQVACSPPAQQSCATPIILRPTGNGALNNWDTQFPNSGSHWQKVSEATADEDSAYLSSTVDARWDDFAHAALNIAPSATINSVTIYTRSRWVTSSTNNIIGPALRSGSSVVWADRTITNSYSNVSGVWNSDPATGQAWTQAGVNSAYIGARKSYQGADVRVTQVWAEVRCTGP